MGQHGYPMGEGWGGRTIKETAPSFWFPLTGLLPVVGHREPLPMFVQDFIGQGLPIPVVKPFGNVLDGNYIHLHSSLMKEYPLLLMLIFITDLYPDFNAHTPLVPHYGWARLV